MWGCEFYYGKDGGIEFLKKLVTHTEKTRYLFQLAKGIDNAPKNNDDEGNNFVCRDASAKELHLRLTQVIYVGDASSDIRCFSLLNEQQGIAIGVYKDSTAQDWSREVEISQIQRVINLAPAEYSEDSELMRSLTLAVESLAKKSPCSS